MKKLYCAKRTHSVVFASAENRSDNLLKDANRWLKKQDDLLLPRVELTTITTPDQIPEGWEGSAIIWGVEEQITAHDFLRFIDPKNTEYQEYLRLKAIYE